MNYFRTSNLWLSLEHWYNEGMTPAEAKEIIESISDPASSLDLNCRPSGLNGNWIVETSSNDKFTQHQLVLAIEDALTAALAKKVGKEYQRQWREFSNP